jgi:hypothetical protein
MRHGTCSAISQVMGSQLRFSLSITSVLRQCLTITVLFCSLEALAMRCEGLLQAPVRLSLDVKAVDVPYAKAYRHYEKAIRAAYDMTITAGLKFPQENFEVFVHPFFNHPASRASLHARRDVIAINSPYQWVIEKKAEGDKWVHLFNSPKRTLPVFWHEVGHAVMRENAGSSRSPVLREYYLYRRKVVEHALLYIKDLEAIELLKISDDEKAIMTSKLEEQLNQRLAENEKRVSAEYQKVIESLDEFFGDFFAVLLSENPNAISEANSVNYDGQRVFNNEAQHDSLEARDFKQKNSSSAQDRTDIYRYFNPARIFLYENYLKGTTAIKAGNKERTLQKVYEAMEQMVMGLERDHAVGNREENNQRLINALKSTFN